MEPYQSAPEPRVQQALPNASAVLVLGILSIILCCCYGGGGILGIISLVLASRDEKLYQADPQKYLPGSIKNLRAGKVCSIVGLCLCAIYLLLIIIIILNFGFDSLTHPGLLQERLNQWRTT